MSEARESQTEFAAAERATLAEVEHDALYFEDIALLRRLLDAIPDVFMVLNAQRQIVFANQSLLDLVQLDDAHQALGLRPGEILDCVHAFDRESGCGTTEFCRTCGAVRAILSSLQNRAAVQECRITQRSGDSLDLEVQATPLHIEDRQFSLFAVRDISHEKRRRILERIFFHDLLNTAGGVYGFAQLLGEASIADLEEIKGNIYDLSARLIEEIRAQQELTAAENDDLALHVSDIGSLALLYETILLYEKHEVAVGRRLQMAPGAQSVVMRSDKQLLGRVVGNMVKNALEACPSGDIVTLDCTVFPDAVEFSVHNPITMPRAVQLQVFQRSFSTKGSNRGLGTYSMKLLSERYLQGQVSFTSRAGEGTTFRARYPLFLFPGTS